MVLPGNEVEQKVPLLMQCKGANKVQEIVPYGLFESAAAGLHNGVVDS